MAYLELKSYWPPRVSKAKLRRLYESDAAGLLDEELLDDIGYAFLLRCRAILMVAEAQRGRVQCLRCAHAGRESIIDRPRDPEEQMTCPLCSWKFTWNEYYKSYKPNQLNPGHAEPIFQAYVDNFVRSRTPREKMLAIDRAIHEFHYFNQMPCRSTGVNFIEGKLTDVLIFLEALTLGGQATPEMRASHEEWRRKMRDEVPWLPASYAGGKQRLDQ